MNLPMVTYAFVSSHSKVEVVYSFNSLSGQPNISRTSRTGEKTRKVFQNHWVVGKELTKFNTLVGSL